MEGSHTALSEPIAASSSEAQHSVLRSAILLLATSLGLAGGYTSLFAGTTGVFLLPIASSLGSGRAVASTCLAMASLGLALGAPIAGKLMDRYGAYRVIAWSLALFVASLLLICVGPATPMLIGFKTFVIGLLAVATSPVGYLPILARSFERRTGFAFGVASIGAGIGAASAPWVARWAMTRYGWEQAYAVLGVLAAVMGMAALLLLRVDRQATLPIPAASRGGQHGPSNSLRESLAEPRFWIISISIAIVAAVGLGSIVHIPALLTDKGLSANQAVAGAAFSAIGLTIGRFGAGVLLDIVPARVVACGAFLLGAVGGLILATSSNNPSYALLATGAALTGMLVGAEGDLMPFLVKRYFGLSSFGSVYGVMISLFCLGTLGGPILFGIAFDRLQSYTPVMMFASAACVVSAFAITLIGPYRYPR
ncbi:MFS transporter [Caballeronia sp. LZ035]|uniref:MFS transporter n=1 Tax=Caballeronia sp. LZ035 TaxID=3038568 RepID=UPI0028647A48|nr:MFS transporter [Caballeronia sp. LZ035]MDR5761376.1 MFS transporter [Caballeronia sp. LZ035]